MPASGSEKVTKGLRLPRDWDRDPPSWQLQVPTYKTGKLITLTTATWLMILVDWCWHWGAASRTSHQLAKYPHPQAQSPIAIPMDTVPSNQVSHCAGGINLRSSLNFRAMWHVWNAARNRNQKRWHDNSRWGDRDKDNHFLWHEHGKPF